MSREWKPCRGWTNGFVERLRQTISCRTLACGRSSALDRYRVRGGTRDPTRMGMEDHFDRCAICGAAKTWPAMCAGIPQCRERAPTEKNGDLAHAEPPARVVPTCRVEQVCGLTSGSKNPENSPCHS